MDIMRPVKATVLDDDRFRLLAIPFHGPIKHAAFPKGVDVDGESFEGVDVKAGWLSERPTDWHHGGDVKMGRTTIGKAINLTLDEDEGWWVDVWLKHGERRLDLIRRLAQQAVDTGKAQIFGSSESVAGMVVRGPWQYDAKAVYNDPALPINSPLRRGLARAITVWPYVRQTLSTSPQNTHSIIRPLKAQLDDLVSEGMAPSAAFWSDIEAAMRNLGADLRATSGDRGDIGAKAGRVLRAENEADLRAALAALEEATERFRGVLSRQPDYSVAPD